MKYRIKNKRVQWQFDGKWYNEDCQQKGCYNPATQIYVNEESAVCNKCYKKFQFKWEEK
jgi:hypothetical protein